MQTIRRTYPLSPLPAALVMARSLGAFPPDAATATRDTDDTAACGDSTIRADEAAVLHAGGIDDPVAPTTCAPLHSDPRSDPPNA